MIGGIELDAVQLERLVGKDGEGLQLPPRMSSVCSTASWVVTMASPAAVAIAAGPPPS